MQHNIGRWLVIGLCATLGACAALRSADLAREKREASVDHAACAGFEFPGDGYTNCRRHAADARAKQRWLELSMNQQLARQRDSTLVETPPAVPYRPIDPRSYGCEARGTEADPWVSCAER